MEKNILTDRNSRWYYANIIHIKFIGIIMYSFHRTAGDANPRSSTMF